ncbi:MAG TPA: tetratricopeptide repeat protein [Pyrinomonadaceae bacterium]|nr:tetratricopeptide repeat protein [Pyrinomonadaceae bacterium]
MNAANQLFNNQKWEEAAKAYEVIVAAEPDNARAWYQLGDS